jgi:hypothetical protein
VPVVLRPEEEVEEREPVEPLPDEGGAPAGPVVRFLLVLAWHIVLCGIPEHSKGRLWCRGSSPMADTIRRVVFRLM